MDTTMSAIDAKITALEADIEQLTRERNLLSPSDETKEARRDLLLAITASRQNLHDLTLERRQQQQAASVLSGSVGTGGDQCDGTLVPCGCPVGEHPSEIAGAAAGFQQYAHAHVSSVFGRANQPPLFAPQQQQHTEKYPYERRRYILSGLIAPPGLLTYGIRRHIVELLVGRPIAGTVNRANLDGYGQCVIVVATASPDTLDNFERDVLTSEYWSDWERTSRDPRQAISSFSFNIIQSLRGSACGNNSDPAHDNKSEKSSSGQRSVSC